MIIRCSGRGCAWLSQLIRVYRSLPKWRTAKKRCSRYSHCPLTSRCLTSTCQDVAGLQLCVSSNRLSSRVGVIILTLHTGMDLLLEALEMGIRGYVLKSSAVTDIADGVRRVAGGDTYFSPEVHRMLQHGAARKPVPPELAGLSPIEVRLVQQIAEGKTSREIAASLGLSARTIENYRTSICAKLNLTGPNALLRYALSKRSALRQS